MPTAMSAAAGLGGREMAIVYITLKVMPEGVETDLNELAQNCREKIEGFGGNILDTKEEPIAFGLKAVIIRFSMSEEKGSTDSLEQEIKEMSSVAGVEVIDVRRGIG